MEENWLKAETFSEAGSVSTCATCGAWVSAEHKQRHLDWHEKLRRAVDETDSLG
jgi:hypothetical protein